MAGIAVYVKCIHNFAMLCSSFVCSIVFWMPDVIERLSDEEMFFIFDCI
jgi:hypothetical protein